MAAPTRVEPRRPVHPAQRDGKRDVKIFHVVLVDLVERGIAMCAVVLIDHQPVLRLLVGVHKPLRRDVGGQSRN